MERLLEFDCSVVGNSSPSLRYRGMQYLDADYTRPTKNWKREFPVKNKAFQLDLTGFRQVETPAGVTKPRDPTFFDGEIW